MKVETGKALLIRLWGVPSGLNHGILFFAWRKFDSIYGWWQAAVLRQESDSIIGKTNHVRPSSRRCTNLGTSVFGDDGLYTSLVPAIKPAWERS